MMGGTPQRRGTRIRPGGLADGWILLSVGRERSWWGRRGSGSGLSLALPPLAFGEVSCCVVWATSCRVTDVGEGRRRRATWAAVARDMPCGLPCSSTGEGGGRLDVDGACLHNHTSTHVISGVPESLSLTSPDEKLLASFQKKKLLARRAPTASRLQQKTFLQ